MQFANESTPLKNINSGVKCNRILLNPQKERFKLNLPFQSLSLIIQYLKYNIYNKKIISFNLNLKDYTISRNIIFFLSPQENF